MKWIERASLRQRLSIPIIVFTMVLFILFQGYNYISTYQIQKDNLINRIKVLTNGVSVNLQAALLFDDEITAQEVLSAFSVDAEILQARLLKSDGSVFAEYHRNGIIMKAPSLVLQEEVVINGFAIGDTAIYILIPVTLNNEQIAKIRLVVSKQELTQMRNKTLQISFFMFGLIIVCGYLFILKIHQWIITPVSKLNQAMQGIITKGEFNVRPSVITHDELGDLTLSFNKMADKLEERQKQLNIVLGKVEQERDFGEQIITAVQHGLFAVNNQGKILLSNDASKKLFPQTLNLPLKDSLLSDIIKPLEENMLSMLVETSTEVDDLLIHTKDGVALQITTRSLSNKEQLLLSVVDVTEAIKSRTQQKLAANVFKNSQDGVLIFDADGSLTLMNPAFTAIFGYELEELMKLSMKELFDGHHFSTSTDLITESIYRFGQWHGEVLEKNKLGEELPLYVKASKIIDDEQTGQDSYIFIFTNLFDVKEKERLDYLAHHDSLTGLPNRSKFYQIVNKTLAVNKDFFGQIGLCYLDLDGFKAINDNYGHDAGDEVLKVVAKRLEHAVRQEDLACRLAGDEFVLFINAVQSIEQLTMLSTRVIEVIQKPISYQNERLSVGISIGITVAQYSDEKDIDVLLKEADNAMYQAKLSGKGQFKFHKV